MRYLTVSEVIDLQRLVLERSGGMAGIRDRNALESAVAQPTMAFGGEELYPMLADKAAALGFSLIKNHPFVDGNKRIGHAAMESFLVLNRHEINASVDEQEQIILKLAASTIGRPEFTEWVRSHVIEKAAS
jgi:death on curing protein